MSRASVNMSLPDMTGLETRYSVSVEELQRRCEQSVESFHPEGKETRTVFIDNGGSVLAVAHRDTYDSHFFQELNTVFQVDRPKKGHIIVRHPYLDDRLGCWLILDMLPRLGLVYDVLLTTDEECGYSSGAEFDTPKGKHYNWMFSFDRAGSDVVMYDYETRKLEKKLKAFRFEVGDGTFSDISVMDHLGIAGFNFGCGYHCQHSDKCYADLRETFLSVSKFRLFFNRYKNTKFRHSASNKWSFSSRRSYQPLSTYRELDPNRSTCSTLSNYTYKRVVGEGGISAWVPESYNHEQVLAELDRRRKEEEESARLKSMYSDYDKRYLDQYKKCDECTTYQCDDCPEYTSGTFNPYTKYDIGATQ